ncbi:uncharacterized protein KY384_000933 [Bacidia gigantensis]|uniref:uncharacterized protein n=1 Tax=Bacidia gigantensis TaxID=2732470 RepID=UPI001D0429B3|nr:uncharacterized protein KY384_000933 [Bacidia gigantensis]KAG8534090.1 hypothetical protein KY384_000933 [Bacidia gigantensis]
MVMYVPNEPNDFLLGHRTTEELPSEADVVIVGSGITGASAARFLLEDKRAKGLEIVMLEAREVCWGATGRNGGHCQPLLVDSTPDVALFEIRNWETIRDFIELHHVPCEWRVVEACRTYWSQALADEVSQRVAHFIVTEPELASRIKLERDQVKLRRAHRVNGAPIATLTTNAASLWPYKLITNIIEKLIQGDGINLQTQTPVTSIESCGTPTSSARWRLHTSRGSITARHVILATNGYTSHLLPEFSDLIVPERGELSALLPPKNSTRLPNSYGFVGANDGMPHHDDYLNQRPFSGVPNPAGHLMFGGGKASATMEHLATTDDSVIDEGEARYLRRELLHLLDLDGETEGLQELKATHEWSGIWGTSRDHAPWVGAVPQRKGVWLAGGYTGHGMPNGTLCGRAVVEMLLGEESGAPQDYVEEKLVRTGNLPQSYIISEERIARARELDTVQEQEAKGWRGPEKPTYLRT